MSWTTARLRDALKTAIDARFVALSGDDNTNRLNAIEDISDAVCDEGNLNLGGGSGDTYALKTSDQTGVGITFEDVTGTGLAVGANTTYAFEFVLVCDANSINTGIDVACNGPASPVSIVHTQEHWSGVTAMVQRGGVAYDTNHASNTSNGTDQRLCRVWGVLVNGANAGTLIARVKRENTGGASAAVRAGSYGRLRQIS